MTDTINPTSSVSNGVAAQSSLISPELKNVPVVELSVTVIRTDGQTQSRAGMNFEVVREYAERMREGDIFPPLDVYFDGSKYWLADGFHRLEANRTNQSKMVRVRLYTGTRREALFHSIRSNTNHGLQRNDADKRMVVLLLLQDDEWGVKSNYELARYCLISAPFVRKIKNEVQSLSNNSKKVSSKVLNRYAGISQDVIKVVVNKLKNQPTTKIIKRGNQTFTMNTAKIGKKKVTEKLKEVLPQAKAISQGEPKLPAIERKSLNPNTISQSSTTGVTLIKRVDGLQLETTSPHILAEKVKQAYTVDQQVELCLKIIGSENSMMYSLFRARLNQVSHHPSEDKPGIRKKL